MSGGTRIASYPLAALQPAMLVNHLRAPRSGVDIVQMVSDLHERVDVRALRSAWEQITERHDALRTGFRWDGVAEPVQDVYDVAAPPVVLLNWTDGDAATNAERFRAFMADDRALGFDLSRPPLQRVTLMQLGDDEWRMVWTFHHILMDGRSFPIVLREMFAIYEATLSGETATLKVRRPFRDFVEWYAAKDFSGAEPFWRERMRGLPGATPVPAGFGGAEIGRGWHTRMLAADPTAALERMAKANGLTMNNVVQGAWALLLARHAGEDDVVFGATRACRKGTIDGADDIVGMLINTLPVRVRVQPDLPLTAWLAELRETWRSLFDVEHTPLRWVQRWSDVSTNMPMFQTSIVYENATLDATLKATGGGMASRGFELFGGTNFPLTALVWGGTEMTLQMDNERAAVDDATALRLLDHLAALLEAMGEHPDANVGELSMLPAQERELVLRAWNDTAVAYPAEATLVSLMAAQAERTPNAAAVSDAQRSLTYAELDAHATTLAHQLRSHGVGRGVLVGVCAERSVEMVIALVAVVKAGGAYVPLDPDYPAERLAFMLEDADAPVVLAQRAAAGVLPAHGARVVWLDDVASAHTAVAAPLAGPSPDDAAYMIFTSGSTGRPKGALNSHRGIVNRLLWMQGEYELTAKDAVLQKTPFSFDVSVWEFFLPLLSGARLVMAEPGGHRDPAYLAEVIAAQQITVLHFVPSMLRNFLEEPAAATCGASLRDVMCSGEALPYDLQQRFFSVVCGDGRRVGLHNLYGPTECAVDVSYWACIRDDERRTVPIGRPVANTQLYVLDAAMEPVPIGVAGELYLGGVQVGAGYWGRPELTAERFVPDLFATGQAPAAGALLYKTGDLARWLPDGVVEYLGRLDFQVKLRGFRIELGEIETALSAHAGVREVVVVAREDLPGGAALLAYYSTRGDQKPTSAELRALLRASLPEYMVPSAFVELETLPLSPSGKVDRKALPMPDEMAAAERLFVAPRTPAEEQVAAIWRAVLNVQQVGVHDDFFDVGGHSLLAMRVAARIHAATGIRISFRELFTARTVESLAARIAEPGAQTVAEDEAIPVRADRTTAPLSFQQELLWLQAQMAPTAATYNVPLALRIRGPVDLTRLRSALAALSDRHEALRTAFEEAEDGPRQRIAAKARTNVMEVDLTEWDADEREHAALTHMRRAALEPFDLTRAPLMRATVIRLAPDDTILLVVVHHIVFDGGSVGILLDELFALYDGRSADTLPRIGAQYGDFAAWQRERLAGARLDALRAFWHDELTGAPEQVSLPKERGARGSHREGRRVEGSVAAECLPALRRIGRERGATLYMTVLAAFQVLLHELSNDADIVIGSPVSGREHAELEGTIGFLANTLPMRARFDDAELTFDTLLQRTRDASLRAYEHQEMPYEQLLLNRIAEKQAPDAALFSVLFVQQDDSAGERTLSGASATAIPVALDTAKFDLALSVRDEGDTLHASLHYRADLMEDASASAALARFGTLLGEIAADPMRPVRALGGGSPRAQTHDVKDAVDPHAYHSPEGPVEEVIAGIWSEMLGRARIGREDPFFDVGGHSLLATRIVARVTSLLRARIPIRAFFADPTIRGMAAALVSAEEKAGQTSAVARAVLKLRGMSADDRARLAASRSAASQPRDNQ